MAADHRQIIQRFYDLHARQDMPALLELFHPEVVMHAAENFIYATGNPYVGVEAIRDLIFARAAADWDVLSAIPEEILGAGEVVIARGRYKGTYKATGTAINAEFVHVFRFKNGRISDWQSYTDTAQFKEAIGGQAIGVTG
jgi:uncharacterized protein